MKKIDNKKIYIVQSKHINISTIINCVHVSLFFTMVRSFNVLTILSGMKEFALQKKSLSYFTLKISKRVNKMVVKPLEGCGEAATDKRM